MTKKAPSTSQIAVKGEMLLTAAVQLSRSPSVSARNSVPYSWLNTGPPAPVLPPGERRPKLTTRAGGRGNREGGARLTRRTTGGPRTNDVFTY